MFQRLKMAIEAGQDAVASAEHELANAPVERNALLVLDEIGPGAQELKESYLRKVEQAQKGEFFILGPKSEHEFAELGVLCEFLPLSEHIFRTTGDRPDAVQHYLQNRLRNILDKWKVETCYWHGETAAELVDALNQQSVMPQRPIDFQRA